jgi:ornithine decarboxylase
MEGVTIGDARKILIDRPLTQKSLYISSPKFIENLVDSFHSMLPRVVPHYAVKCNDDEVLLKTLIKKGVNFDCASGSEIKKVMSLGAKPEHVIFAHTIKSPDDILLAKDKGVNITTFDSIYEVDKLKVYHSECELVLRIRCDDPNATISLGSKYGANHEDIPELLQYAFDHNMKVVGISFHVGSGSRNPDAFYKAIKHAKEAFDISSKIGHDMRLLDIGGGFYSDLNEDGELSTCVTEYINDGLEDFFKTDKVKVIAEPGRFFAEHYSALCVQVIGKRKREGVFEYFINDGTYGNFSNCIFEKAVPEIGIVRKINDDEPEFPSVIYGCTCDSVDIIRDSIVLPELQVDDWLFVPSWGAYSRVLVTTFNGFGQYEMVYI